MNIKVAFVSRKDANLPTEILPGPLPVIWQAGPQLRRKARNTEPPKP